MKTQTCLLTAWLAAANAVYAQPWAKAELEKSPRHGEWVEVTHGARVVRCFVVYPEVKNPAPAVLVIHEIFGLTDWARSAADEVAAAGCIAIAPDFLSGLGPKGGGSEAFASVDDARAAVGKLPPAQVTADLDAAAKYAKSLPSASGKLAVAGFCWGGGQAFRYAAHGADLKASFVFYGPPPDKKDMPKINGPVYGFYGGNDARISSTIPAATADMKAAGKTYEPVTYDGAGHGFMRAGEDPAASPENKKARDDAWKRFKELLGKL